MLTSVGARAATRARSYFGDAIILLFVVVQSLDAGLTYVGVATFGVAM